MSYEYQYSSILLPLLVLEYPYFYSITLLVTVWFLVFSRIGVSERIIARGSGSDTFSCAPSWLQRKWYLSSSRCQIRTKKPSSDPNKILQKCKWCIFITEVSIIIRAHDASIGAFRFPMDIVLVDVLNMNCVGYARTISDSCAECKHKCKIQVSHWDDEEHSTIVGISSSISTVVGIQGNSKIADSASETEGVRERHLLEESQPFVEHWNERIPSTH